MSGAVLIELLDNGVDCLPTRAFSKLNMFSILIYNQEPNCLNNCHASEMVTLFSKLSFVLTINDHLLTFSDICYLR